MTRSETGDRAAFLRQAGARVFEPMPGRAMREYVVVPAAVLKSRAKLNGWLNKALAYAQALPPKAAKSTSVKPARKRRSEWQCAAVPVTAPR